MKNNIKIILVIVFVVVALGFGWFLYLIYGPQLSMEEVLPSKPMFYAALKEPVYHWDSLEKSDLYKEIVGIDVGGILKHNKVAALKAEEFHKSYAQVVAMMKNPVVGKLLGKEIAIAQYPSKEPKAGLVLVTRSRASIQMAASLSVFLKDLGTDIEVKKDHVDGQVIVHLSFKQKDLSFKYTHMKGLLIFTEESSTLINDVIKTVRHQYPSLASDQQFKEVKAQAYSNAQGVLYFDIKGFVQSETSQWPRSLSNPAGFKAFGLSFLPGSLIKYKFLMTFDPTIVDPSLKAMLTCTPLENKGIGFVPPSAIAYHWGGCYAFKEMASSLRTGAESALGNQPKSIRKSLQKKLSSTQAADFIDLLGQEAGVYVTDVDTHAMLPYPRLLFFVKMTDPLKAKSLVDELIGSKQSFSLIGRENYIGNDIHFVALPLGGNMDPGFAVTGDYFLAATSRQLLKKSMDIYADPSRSLRNDKQYKQLDLNGGAAPSGIFYFKVKEMASRALEILEWYDRYLLNQIGLSATYKKEAESKKKELDLDIVSQKEELRLAEAKLKEWMASSREGLSAEELENNMDTIKNIEEQIKQGQALIKENQIQMKNIDKVVIKNEMQAENNRRIMYNASHVLVPFFKGLGSINTQGIKFSTSSNTVEVEIMLN